MGVGVRDPEAHSRRSKLEYMCVPTNAEVGQHCSWDSCLLNSKQEGMPESQDGGTGFISNVRSWWLRLGKRNVRKRGHYRRYLKSDDMHDLGIKTIFL